MEHKLTGFVPHRSRKKTGLRIPESHSLYLCPPSCGRRTGLRAVQNGEASHVSFLQLEEQDLIDGDYASMIGDAVEGLLSVLEPVPKVFLLYLSCVDSLLGTDGEALLAALRQRFPKLGFTLSTAAPLLGDNAVSPGAEIQAQLYSALTPRVRRTDTVNLIGPSFVGPDRQGELFSLLDSWGITQINFLPELTAYRDFAGMSSARLNLVLMSMGQHAAEQMESRMGIPWVSLPVCYDLEEIEAAYTRLAEALGCPPRSWTAEWSQTLQAISVCRDMLGGAPIYVDSSASMTPFALAKALCKYGFSVRGVLVTHEKQTDTAARQWLTEQHPEVELLLPWAYELDRLPPLPDHAIAVGFDGACAVKARHFVDLQRDEGLFGFHGLRRLMTLLEECFMTESWWE